MLQTNFSTLPHAHNEYIGTVMMSIPWAYGPRADVIPAPIYFMWHSEVCCNWYHNNWILILYTSVTSALILLLGNVCSLNIIQSNNYWQIIYMKVYHNNWISCILVWHVHPRHGLIVNVLKYKYFWKVLKYKLKHLITNIVNNNN